MYALKKFRLALQIIAWKQECVLISVEFYRKKQTARFAPVCGAECSVSWQQWRPVRTAQ